VRTPDGRLSSSMFNPTPKRPLLPAATLSRTTLAGRPLLPGPDPCYIFKLVFSEGLANGLMPDEARLVHGADGSPLLSVLCRNCNLVLGYSLPRWALRAVRFVMLQAGPLLACMVRSACMHACTAHGTLLFRPGALR
jgi:hypothetical protein